MKLVCIGDSLTYGYDVPPGRGWVSLLARELRMRILNRGACGDTTAGMRLRFSRDVLDERPDWVCIMGGSNDILLDITSNATRANIAAMVRQARQADIGVILGIPPLTRPESCWYGWQAAADVVRHNDSITAYRQWILEQFPQPDIGHIDFYEAFCQAGQEVGSQLYADGIHPNERGYELFARTAAVVLRQCCI
jgi:acyl-CoA thioesterase-1